MEPTSLQIYNTLPDLLVFNINQLQEIEDSPLRKKALPLEFPLTDEDQRDIRTITMKFQTEHDISSMAAPQIGISKRIIIFNVPLQEDDPVFQRLWINPVYEKIDDELKGHYELCSSIEDMIGPVKRYKKVRYKAYDTDGNLVEGVVKGYAAKMIQHEVEHLDGILYIDLVRKGKLVTIKKYVNLLNKYVNKGLPYI